MYEASLTGIDVGAAEAVFTTVIISYRRDATLAVTLERLKELVGIRHDHLMILVDNNADGIDRSEMLSGFLRSRYVQLDTNEGVTGGRNAGIRAVEGEVVLFLDDDAYLEGPGDLVDALLREFRNREDLGAVAFRSVVGSDKRDDPAEFPHTDKKLPRDEGFETFRYIGVAHALRASALRSIGGYRPEFFYGMEEFDMSFRLLKAGFRIFFLPEFMVHHRKEPNGRLIRRDVLRRMYLNKLRVAWMHLPLGLFCLCAVAWAAKTAKDSRSAILPLGSIKEFVSWATANRQDRKPASDEIICRIRRLGGSPWK